MNNNDKKLKNKEWSTKKLQSEGVDFKSFNDGLHLTINHKGAVIDFWPTTGKFKTQKIKGKKGGKEGRGVKNLLSYLKSFDDEGCMCCGQFPYYKDIGMCAVCTFGEAEAQIELIENGHNDPNVIYF